MRFTTSLLLARKRADFFEPIFFFHSRFRNWPSLALFTLVNFMYLAWRLFSVISSFSSFESGCVLLQSFHRFICLVLGVNLFSKVCNLLDGYRGEGPGGSYDPLRIQGFRTSGTNRRRHFFSAYADVVLFLFGLGY
jgi:hypothetical protein